MVWFWWGGAKKEEGCGVTHESDSLHAPYLCSSLMNMLQCPSNNKEIALNSVKVGTRKSRAVQGLSG